MLQQITTRSECDLKLCENHQKLYAKRVQLIGLFECFVNEGYFFESWKKILINNN